MRTNQIYLGAEKVQSLDLAGNFLVEFPSASLKSLKELRYLNLSSNIIQVRFFPTYNYGLLWYLLDFVIPNSKSLKVRKMTTSTFSYHVSTINKNMGGFFDDFLLFFKNWHVKNNNFVSLP